MSKAELFQYIYHGSEERNLEYKKSMSWNNAPTKAKVVKSCIAMSNIPDGGVIVFGVDEMSHGNFQANGMDPEYAKSFNQDDIQDYVNGFADPYVELKVDRVVDKGKEFVVIQIREFAEMPIVCKKPGEEGLQRGGVYTRPRRKHETALVSSQTEMRELLDLAIDKQIRKYREKMFRWGVLPRTPSPEEIAGSKFKEQRGDFE